MRPLVRLRCSWPPPNCERVQHTRCCSSHRPCPSSKQVEFADVIILNKADVLAQWPKQVRRCVCCGQAGGVRVSSACHGRHTQLLGNDTSITDPPQPTQEQERLRRVLRQLNARAEVLEASHCAVDLARVLDTGRFDMDQVGAGVAPTDA